MTGRRILIGAALGLAACSSVVSLTSIDAGMSVVVPSQPNAAANGAEVVPILIRLANNAGEPLSNLQVTLTSEHCLLAQPTNPTDATGTARGQMRCATPGLQQVGITIAFNDATAPLQTTAQVNFYPAANSSGAVQGGTALLAQAVAYDANNTVDLGYRGTVVFTSSDPLATLPAPQTLAASDHGYRPLPKSLILRTEGRQTVTCTDQASGRVLSTETLTVVPSPATSLLVSVADSPLQAGVFTSVTVSAIDGYGNVNPSYTGTVSFASSDPLAQLPDPYTFGSSDAGTKTFLGSLTLRTAGQQLLFAQDGPLSGLQKVSVVGGPATGLQLVVDGNAVAGVPNDVTVRATDIYGNASSNYTGTVHFTSSDANALVPPDHLIAVADAGTLTLEGSLVLYQAGLSSMLVSDSNNAAIQVGTENIRTVAAAPERLDLRAPTSALAGTSQNLTVVAEDAYGNPSASYRGSVSFSTTDPLAAAPSTYAFQSTDGGAHSFVQSLRLLSAGTTVTTVRDSTGLQNGTATTVVSPAGLAALRVTGPTTAGAGSSIDLTVSAVDNFNNIIPTFGDTVQLSNADPQGSCVASVALSQGSATVTAGASFVTSGAWNVAAVDPADSSLASLPLLVQVTSGPLASLNLSLPVVLVGNSNSASVGQLLTPVVAAFDAYQNPVASYRGTVHFSSNDSSAILPPDTTFTASNAGSITFPGAVTLLTVSNNTSVTVTDVANNLSSSITGTNVYHRCGYFDGNGYVPYPGGFVRSSSAAIDPNGHIYFVDETELGAVAYTVWQLYATQWTGASWTTNETPPRPATSLIDNASYTSYVQNPAVMMDGNGNPAVAFEGYGATQGIFYVQRRSGTWSGLGGSDATPLGVNGVTPRLLLDSTGAPWIVWLDSANALHLRAWNGTAWALVGGNELIPATAVSSNVARPNFDVAMDAQNHLYVTWGNGPSIFLTEWNGSAWTDLGGSSTGQGLSQSAGAANLPALAITSSGPAVSWSDTSSGYAEVYLRQWTGSAWAQVGASATGGGISNEQGTATNYSLTVDHHGRLLALWAVSNGGNCASANVPFHFRRFGGSTWDSIANSADYSGCDYVCEASGYGQGSNAQMFVDLNDIPIVAFNAFANIGSCAFY